MPNGLPDKEVLLLRRPSLESTSRDEEEAYFISVEQGKEPATMPVLTHYILLFIC
jgi:hypothetical protein